MKQRLLTSGLIVSAMTFLSRIFGLLRDILIFHLLGSHWAADIFLIAQKIPNFLRRLFAEGAFSQAFIPVLSEYQSTQNPQAIKTLISETFGTLAIILVGVTLIGIIASPLLVSIFGPGFIDEPHKFDLASLLLKITFPYIFFIALTAFSGAILNTLSQFLVPALTPVLLNISIISAAIIVYPTTEVAMSQALAWGVFFAGIFQLLLQFPFLWKAGYLVKPQWGWKSSGVQKILTLMGPTIFGVSVAQINLLLDSVLASFLESGSITWLYVSDRMLEFPLGMFAIAIATVILPSLAKEHADNNQDAFNETFNWGIKLVCLMGIPAAIGLFMLAEPIILTVFQHGEFSLHDAHASSRSLQAYLIGLLGFMLIKVFATGFFSQKDTKTPVKIAIIAMSINMIFNLILFFPLKHVGLALATSISALSNAFLLFYILKKRKMFIPDSTWLKWGIRFLSSALILWGFLKYYTATLFEWQTWSIQERVYQMCLIIAFSIAVYGISLFCVGVRFHELRYAHSKSKKNS
jgi:putative peptidoglycan lipid II flippase